MTERVIISLLVCLVLALAISLIAGVQAPITLALVLGGWAISWMVASA